MKTGEPQLAYSPCIYFEIKWGDKDSNLGRRSQQIYSLPPLTARESPHIDEPT